jgi:hypothetical protein
LIDSFLEFFGLSGGVVNCQLVVFEFFGVTAGVARLRGERNIEAAAIGILGDPSSLKQQRHSHGGMTSCAGGVRHATPCMLGLECATGRFGIGICWAIFEDHFFEVGDARKVTWPGSSSG